MNKGGKHCFFSGTSLEKSASHIDDEPFYKSSKKALMGRIKLFFSFFQTETYLNKVAFTDNGS